jgi:TIR domain
MEWDFFISHASEDKTTVVIPLARELERAGFRVWLDAFEIKVGDDIRARIDEGLTRSRFGIVVASPAYFAKKWSSAELGALFALEGAHRRVLPVWHELDAQAVASRSPLLASRAAISISRGDMYAAARSIVLELGDQIGEPKSVVGRFTTCLDRSDLTATRAFIAHYPEVLFHAAGLTYGTNKRAYFRTVEDESRGEHNADIILELYFPAGQPSLPGHSSYHIITLGPVNLTSGAQRLEGAHRALVATESFVKEFTARHARSRCDVQGVAVLGRRGMLTNDDISALGAGRVNIRSYGWLVDSFLQYSASKRDPEVRIQRGPSLFSWGAPST